jgi:putative endonuclease
MHFIYIIYTAKFNKYYIGETVNISDRLEEHKTGHFKESTTKYTDDWVLVLSLQTDSRRSAREIERYIKSMKSKKFIKRLISETAYLDVFKQIVKDKFQIELL